MKLIQNILNTLQRGALLTLALAAIATAHSTALARDQVPFRAEYQNEIESVVNLPFASITSTGNALATHLGRVTARSVEETVNLLTGEGVATHRFTAANGDTILVEFVFIAIPTSATVFAITGTWQISGGTGRFDGTSGSGTYEGHAEFIGPTSAVGHFVMTGTISSPGEFEVGQ
jgi:hypothetical protein